MSNNTTQLRWIVESRVPDEFPGIRGRFDYYIDNGYQYVFDFQYNFFSPSAEAKIEFEKQFVIHYYKRMIGLETVELWKLFLKDRLNMLYPKYKQLYDSTLLEIDPLNTVRLQEVFDQDTTAKENTKNVTEVEGNTSRNATTNTTNDLHGTSIDNSATDTSSNGTNNTRTTGQEVVSDFPQATLSGRDYASGSSETNGTSNTDTSDTSNTVTKSDNTQNQHTDGNTTTTETTENTNKTDQVGGRENVGTNDHIKVTEGYQGNQSELLLKYRETFLNLNEMLINECRDLFMTINYVEGF